MNKEKIKYIKAESQNQSYFNEIENVLKDNESIEKILPYIENLN